jgi:hypothetical protein
MDLDGDPDLLVNWHHHEPLEVFENAGGRFVQRNPLGNDVSGLYDNRDVPYLFASTEEMTARIDGSDRDGLYVWHDHQRGGSWRLLWRDAGNAYAELKLRLETSLPVLEVTGLQTGELERPGPRRLVATIAGSVDRSVIGVRVRRVATQLRIHLSAAGSGPAPTIYAGRDMIRLVGTEIALWKPDPHGMAWVDVEGSRLPELYITRGGLGGELSPPADPKLDRYYLPAEGGPLPYRLAPPGRVAPGYGRGRRVEWLDLDGDGALELSVANRDFPNLFLVPEGPAGQLRDRAAELGLDRDGAAVQAWGDLDRDGRQDLFFLEDGRIDVLRQRGTGFELVRGDTLGLTLPELPPPPGAIDPTALRLSDFDNDGDLDLWILAHGREGASFLFRRDEQGFTDVTAAVGIAGVRGTRSAVLLDADNDGYEDALLFGERPVLLSNLAGRRFRTATLRNPARISAATACDVDGDGWTDVIAMGRQRHLLRNSGGDANGFLEVALRAGIREPIGALALAYYSDDSVRAQRYGSAHNSAFSQALLPLHFGIARGVSIERLGVRWPGEAEETHYAVRGTSKRVVLER